MISVRLLMLQLVNPLLQLIDLLLKTFDPALSQYHFCLVLGLLQHYLSSQSLAFDYTDFELLLQILGGLQGMPAPRCVEGLREYLSWFATKPTRKYWLLLVLRTEESNRLQSALH